MRQITDLKNMLKSLSQRILLMHNYHIKLLSFCINLKEIVQLILLLNNYHIQLLSFCINWKKIVQLQIIQETQIKRYNKLQNRKMNGEQ